MPVNPLEVGYLQLIGDVYCAGEALSYARVEGAFLSGRAVGMAVALGGRRSVRAPRPRLFQGAAQIHLVNTEQQLFRARA